MSFAILVVDDSETMRRLIKKTLKLTPVDIDTIHEAATGRYALEILRQNAIDLVLSNITMPENSGLELLAAMQKKETLKQIPVIIISAAINPAQLEGLLEHRTSAHLQKPFTRELLRDLVMKVLGDVHEK